LKRHFITFKELKIQLDDVLCTLYVAYIRITNLQHTQKQWAK